MRWFWQKYRRVSPEVVALAVDRVVFYCQREGANLSAWFEPGDLREIQQLRQVVTAQRLVAFAFALHIKQGWGGMTEASLVFDGKSGRTEIRPVKPYQAGNGLRVIEVYHNNRLNETATDELHEDISWRLGDNFDRW